METLIKVASKSFVINHAFPFTRNEFRNFYNGGSNVADEDGDVPPIEETKEK